MKSLAVISLMLVTGIALAWYIGFSIRERRIGTRSWSTQPIRFVLEVLAYVALTALVLYAAVYGIGDVDPVLWALWPGLLGPAVALWLSRKHWGEPASPVLVETLAGLIAAGKLEGAAQVVQSGTREGATRRVLSAALRAPLPEVGASAGYRAAATRSFGELEQALARTLAKERHRGRLRVAPAALAPAAGTLLLVAPPSVDQTLALVIAALEVALGGLALLRNRRRAHQARDTVAALRSALRAS